jgi:hypothetical protein
METINDQSKRNSTLLRKGFILVWKNYSICLTDGTFEDGGCVGGFEFYGFDKLSYAQEFLRGAKTLTEVGW